MPGFADVSGDAFFSGLIGNRKTEFVGVLGDPAGGGAGGINVGVGTGGGGVTRGCVARGCSLGDIIGEPYWYDGEALAALIRPLDGITKPRIINEAVVKKAKLDLARRFEYELCDHMVLAQKSVKGEYLG